MEEHNAEENRYESQVERLKELEAENTRLKDAMAILTLDKLILEEVVEENMLEERRGGPDSGAG